MLIQVKRKTFTDISTIGDMFIDSQFVCYTLEDKTRTADEEHIKGKTSIPYGTYQIHFRKEGTIYESLKKHFTDIKQERGSLHIYNITGNTYPIWYKTPGVQPEACVLIHTGNKNEDTEGCLLVGAKVGKDVILPGESSVAYRKIYPLIAAALDKGEEVRITIEQG